MPIWILETAIVPGGLPCQLGFRETISEHILSAWGTFERFSFHLCPFELEKKKKGGGGGSIKYILGKIFSRIC